MRISTARSKLRKVLFLDHL